MGTILQLLISGIAMGFIYALVAIEYTLIWNSTGLLNFSHDKIITVGAYIFAAPFIIYAIGDPTTLYNALTMRGGVVDVLSQWKINVTVQMSEKLLIEKYTGTIPTDYLSTPTATGEEGSDG